MIFKITTLKFSEKVSKKSREDLKSKSKTRTSEIAEVPNLVLFAFIIKNFYF